MNKAKTVDEYISSSPEEIQPRLKQIRKIIKSLAPSAEEKISYGMPFYDYKGRLVYFASQKKYLGLYIPPPIISNHSTELKNYATTKSAIHFPNDQALPVGLIKNLIKARMKWNEGK